MSSNSRSKVLWLRMQTVEHMVRGVAYCPRDWALQPVCWNVLAAGSVAKECWISPTLNAMGCERAFFAMEIICIFHIVKDPIQYTTVSIDCFLLLGIRGQLHVIVKVDLFTDLNKFRQSSCGVRFFCSKSVITFSLCYFSSNSTWGFEEICSY